MALITCPECDGKVSDRAETCPHCGYPMKKTPRKKPKPNRRRKLPNGFGSITEIKHTDLKNPFYARANCGKDMYNRPILKPLKPEAYFATYEEAREALIRYNKGKVDLSKDMPVETLYRLWFAEYEQEVEPVTARGAKSAFSYCRAIYKKSVQSLRIADIKNCIENGTAIETRGKNKGKIKEASAKTKIGMKSTLSMMLDYAKELEIVDRNCARECNLSKNTTKEAVRTKKQHFSFSASERVTLWENRDMENVDLLLIACYSGWRPDELCQIKVRDVDLENNRMFGGSKTDAGIDRYVPIHPEIKPLIAARYLQAQEFGSSKLINVLSRGRVRPITYAIYTTRFHKIVKDLGLDPNHRPHDTRDTFATVAKEANMDEYALKYIIGHSIADITERIYTDRKPEWYYKELCKIVVDKHSTNYPLLTGSYRY